MKTFEEIHSSKGVFCLMEDVGLRPEAFRFWEGQVQRFEACLLEDNRTDCESPPAEDESDDEEGVRRSDYGVSWIAYL
jgi:hypothetical protein